MITMHYRKVVSDNGSKTYEFALMGGEYSPIMRIDSTLLVLVASEFVLGIALFVAMLFGIA